MGSENNAVEVKKFVADGYTNMLNKVGTPLDNSTAYRFKPELIIDDETLTQMYQSGGLFAKIVDRPSMDAVARGLDLSDLGDELEKQVKQKLSVLNWKRTMIRAEKWSRLYGGAIVVMIVNDGRGLDEPLDIEHATKLEELYVFERAVVTPDYSSHGYGFYYEEEIANKRFGEPTFYNVYSRYGSFRVHYTRCLIFREGDMPEYSMDEFYRDWGTPIYYRVKVALRQAITSHDDAVKLLERSTLGIYAMKGLSELLGSDDGENFVLERLHNIDASRNILNTIAIDADGESYSYLTTSMSGVSDIIDRTYNLISGVTDIPQTILFGRSPAGMNSTGESDFENYYQLLTSIQETNVGPATETIIKLILAELQEEDKKLDVPDYEVRFKPYKQLSEKEEAELESTKMSTEKTKADIANVYVGMQSLDPKEVRRELAEQSAYSIQGIVEEEDIDKFPPPEAQEGAPAPEGGQTPMPAQETPPEVSQTAQEEEQTRREQ